MRFAVNGAGRIGRAVVRLWAGGANPAWHGLELAAINEIAPHEALCDALRVDSRLGPLPAEPPPSLAEGELHLAGRAIELPREPQRDRLRWGEMGVACVLECTGQGSSREQMQLHLRGGARLAVLSNPGQADLDGLILAGEEGDAEAAKLLGGGGMVSASSCTSCALGPVLRALDQQLGIESAQSLTIHAAMLDQPLLDRLADDPDPWALARARAGGGNAVPVPTRLAEGLVRHRPSLRGRLSTLALRVPGVGVSAIHLTARFAEPASEERVLRALREGGDAACIQLRPGPLASVDVEGETAPAVVDLSQLRVLDGGVQLLIWFDNEVGFAAHLLNLAAAAKGAGLGAAA